MNDHVIIQISSLTAHLYGRKGDERKEPKFISLLMFTWKELVRTDPARDLCGFDFVTNFSSTKFRQKRRRIIFIGQITILSLVSYQNYPSYEYRSTYLLPLLLFCHP